MAGIVFSSWYLCPFELVLIVFQKKLSQITNHRAYSKGDVPYVNWQKALEHRLLIGFELSPLLSGNLSGPRFS